MRSPPPPVFRRLHDYGESLGDIAFWAPYVREVLRRHRHPHDGALEAGFVGTYPTFLAGPVVVKLFGCFGTWRADHDAELAVHRLLEGHPTIPAPALVAHGQLYDDGQLHDDGDRWPYLVTARLAGNAWRDIRPPAETATKLARTVGEVIRQVHDLAVPEAEGLQRDWLRDHRSGTVDRQRAWGTLPEHLIEQIPDFLSAPSPHPRLIHADLTEDHLFVDGGHLVGIIDWADAFVTDPYYELAALHFGTFEADRTLLRTFLTGYGWPVDDTFCRRAMSAALLHQFDVLAGVRDLVRGRGLATLDDLAVLLWDVAANPG